MTNCIICKAELLKKEQYGDPPTFECPNCGTYIKSERLFLNMLKHLNPDLYKRKLAAYLLQNRIENVSFIGEHDDYQSYKRTNPLSTARVVTESLVENWYNETFSKK